MNKKLLCTAVGGALALTAGASNAWFNEDSDSIFFPYVVKDTNRTTVVTIIMSNGASTPASEEKIHIQYWTKSTTDANTAACSPSSITVPVTDNDVVTWDTAGLLGYPLFGDTTNPAPLGIGISYAAPRHGFLYVQAPSDLNGSNGIENGYWMELDLANGGAHGDMAWLSYGDRDLTNYSDKFSLYASRNSGNLNDDDEATPVNFWPSSVASTVFTVTPLGTDMLNRENNQMVLQVFNQNSVQGAYDRNENGVDGTVPITVRCVGRVTPAQLMPGVVANAAWAAQGGWGYLANIGDGDASANETQGGTNSGDIDAVVYQIDSSSAGGKFMSNATVITSAQY